MHSPERLLSETALFLHRVESELPERSKAVLEASRHSDASVAGRKVLVVDDDVRNIFAMTSVLEASGLEVIYAENGQAGIEALTKDPDHRPGADGRDDAGDGRLRDDARDPREPDASAASRSSRSPPRRSRTTARSASTRARPTTCRSRSTPTSCSTSSACGPALATACRCNRGQRDRLGTTTGAIGRRPADGRAARQHPDRRRPPGEPGGAGGDPGAARPRAGDGALGRRGAAPHPAARVRAHPAGRADGRT